MNAELVVIANQQVAVNTFSPLAHTAHQMSKVGSSRRLPEFRGDEAKLGDECQVVTRYPYWKVGMDHLLLGEISVSFLLTKRDVKDILLIFLPLSNCQGIFCAYLLAECPALGV